MENSLALNKTVLSCTLLPGPVLCRDLVGVRRSPHALSLPHRPASSHPTIPPLTLTAPSPPTPAAAAANGAPSSSSDRNSAAPDSRGAAAPSRKLPPWHRCHSGSRSSTPGASPCRGAARGNTAGESSPLREGLPGALLGTPRVRAPPAPGRRTWSAPGRPQGAPVYRGAPGEGGWVASQGCWRVTWGAS